MGGMYSRAIMGVAKMQSIEKFAYNLAAGMYSDPVGMYYGDKYFGEEAKRDITEIVYQIIDTYKGRIKTNDILGEETKEKQERPSLILCRPAGESLWQIAQWEPDGILVNNVPFARAVLEEG